MLAGWVRPTIFLPEDSLEWTDAKLEAVFIHELSHWRRHDGWWQTLGALTNCLWWWQPPAWFAANALKLTAEQVADDAVILRQKDASSYAQTLVEMAVSFAEGHRPVGVAMIGRSSLETRVRSLLRDNPWRGRHGRLGMALTLALTGVFLGVGGLYLRSAETPSAPPAATSTPAPKPDTFAPVPSAGAAKGRVINAQGQSVTGASIQPYTEVRGNTHRYAAVDHEKTHTDPEGRFSYAVPGYSAVGVMVVARGYARRHAIIPYDDASHDVVLGSGVEVSGRLLKDGQPLPSIEVGIAQVNRGAEEFLDEIVAKTDGEGRFVLPDVAPNEDYEIHAKRDSLRALGATTPRRVRVGEPGTTVNVGDLTVESGVVVTGCIMLPDGSLPDPEYYITYPDGRRERETNRSVQLHVWRESAYDLQYIDLGPDLRFALPALPGEKLELTAWVPGYKLRSTDRHSGAVVQVAPGIKPVEMVYDPESDEAKERTRHPVFAPPSTPTPTPPSAEQLTADAKAAQDNAAKLAAQPHRTEAQWREQFAKVQVGMTRDEVYALLPNKTVSIDYLQRDEYDEKTVHTSFYALDGEFAVALTFDFKGDEAWNAAGRPSPRPKADENHLINPPVLLRHDKMPNKDNEVQLDRAKPADAPPQRATMRSSPAKAIEVNATVSTEDGRPVGYHAAEIHPSATFGPSGMRDFQVFPSFDSPEGTTIMRIPADVKDLSFAVTNQGYAPAFAGPFSPPLEEKLRGLHFTLTKGFTAEIQVVNEAGQPIAGARVQSIYSKPQFIDLGETTTDGGGSVKFEHLSTVPIDIHVRADGYQTDELDGVQLDPAKPFRWTLKRAQPLEGIVVGAASGQAIVGAKIKLAAVRGPYGETHPDTHTAPLWVTSDLRGHFVLTSLRPDSRYFLFVEAPGHGGVLVREVKVDQPALRVALGPELFIRGRFLHIPAASINAYDHTFSFGYDQFFNIDGSGVAVGQQGRVTPEGGEAEFTIDALYDNSVLIIAEGKETSLEAKALPASGLVIDLAKPTSAKGNGEQMQPPDTVTTGVGQRGR